MMGAVLSVRSGMHNPRSRKKESPVDAWLDALFVWGRHFFREARIWCQGRNCWVRLPVLLFFIYLFYGYLTDPKFSNIFMGLNLGIHEMGHGIFIPVGWFFPNEFIHFITVAAGSAVQCLVPIGAMIMFFRQRDFFGISVALGWLATNLFGVAVYAGDAEARQLPLVSPFGPADTDGHDWYYMLSTTGLLHADHFIEGNLRFLGFVSLLACITFGGWLLNLMRKCPHKQLFSEDALLNVYGTSLLPDRRQLNEEEKRPDQ